MIDDGDDGRIARIENELAEIKVTLDEIREHIVEARTNIRTISDVAGPTIDALMNHPMFKMLGLKKGK